MKSLQAIVLITCIISLLTGIINGMKPNEKFNRQLNLLLSCVFLLAILTPIFHWHAEWQKSPPMLSASIDNTSISEAATEQTLHLIQKNIEQTVCEALTQSGVAWESVSVEAHIQSDNGIYISKITVLSNNTEAAKAVLKTCFGEEVEQIVQTTDKTNKTVAAP